MPLPIPNVPPYPGVPPLPGGGIAAILPVLALVDAIGLGVFSGPQWGIFAQSGAPVLVANSVFGIEYARDYRISDYPQEQGAFESTIRFRFHIRRRSPFSSGAASPLARHFWRRLARPLRRSICSRSLPQNSPILTPTSPITATAVKPATA